MENLDRILAFDVHGLDRHLAAPQVHVPIIRGLLGPVRSIGSSLTVCATTAGEVAPAKTGSPASIS